MSEEVFEIVKRDGLDTLSRAKFMVKNILDDQTFEDGMRYRIDLNRWKKEALKKLEPIRKKTLESHQEILRLIEEVIEPFDESLNILDIKLSEYKTKKDKLESVEQEKRIADSKKEQEESILNAAIEANNSGNIPRAEAILNIPIVQIAVPSNTQKISGISFKEKWKVDDNYINMRLLVDGVFKGIVPISALLPNMQFLNYMAKKLKGDLKYPGVKVVKQNSVSSRTK